MTKYFMKGTDDEVQFGEEIKVVKTENTKTGKKHSTLQCVFTPEIAEFLIAKKVIEAHEVEDPEENDEEEMCTYDDPILAEIGDKVDNLLVLSNKILELQKLIIDHLSKEPTPSKTNTKK